jgi:hypothetical protein
LCFASFVVVVAAALVVVVNSFTDLWIAALRRHGRFFFMESFYPVMPTINLSERSCCCYCFCSVLLFTEFLRIQATPLEYYVAFLTL